MRSLDCFVAPLLAMTIQRLLEGVTRPYRQSALAFAVQRPKPLAIMLRMTAQT